MTGEQARQALERSTPYVTIGNLIALAALLVMSLQAGVLDVSAGGESVSQAEVERIDQDVSANTSSITELYRVNDRQDTVIQSNQARISGRMQRLEEKVDQIYRLLIGRRNIHPSARGEAG